MKKIFSLLIATLFVANMTATNLGETNIDGQAAGIAEREQRPVQDTDKNLIQAALMGWTVKIGGGFNLGGAAPLPLPKEIRKIKGFNPRLNIAIEADAHKQFGKSNWGLMIGVRLEMKRMTTEAGVKNYHLSISPADGGEPLVGVWTGDVKTRLDNSYLSFPVLATYQFGERWRVGLGPYFSCLLSGEFTGEVYNGYLREGDPTGDKYVYDVDADGNRTYATYDYSDELRRFQWGLQFGAEWVAYKHLLVTANVQWGLNNIFKKDFNDITFNMYPIYGTLGFAYKF